jgi:hypothetical protein
MRKCYFDHAATNPLHPAVLEAMMPYFREEFGNALSVYDLGMRARTAIETARGHVGSLINAKPATIVFTSSGSRRTISPCAGRRSHAGNRGTISLYRKSNIIRFSIQDAFSKNRVLWSPIFRWINTVWSIRKH